LNVSSFAVNGGDVLLSGAGAYIDSALSPGAMLYQNYAGDLLAKDINILSDEYDITVDSLTVSGINQKGTLTVNTDSIDVSGDVVANDLRFVLRKDVDGNPVKESSVNIAWLSAEIDGNVSGGVDFIGLDKMVVGKNYTFDSNSTLNAAILPYATGAGSSDINYWSKVSLAQDNTLGEITNASDGAALVQVGGVFTSGVAYDENAFSGNNVQSELANGRIGISLFDAVDQGTAIWLVHADGGVENFGQLEQLRNLNVNFCNADGSICYDYLTSLKDENDTDEDLPAYISVRDSDDDGKKDSLYVVFDPRFGGPILLENMKIQPIVAREPGHTDGEYVSAGALDDLLVGQMYKKKFLNSTPIEVIPLVFEDTNMEQMANELYNRMEYYVESTDATGLARFSRLFQVREIEQIVGGVAINEHTTFRSFEDRMFDEFIWNRNRNPKKAWLDVDYGMFFQNIDDGKHTDGNRFSVSGGFDWQESDTLVLGLTGRVSRTMSDSHDAMDLGYLPGQSISGNVNIDVTDTSVAFGAYLMKILGEKTRLYGNAFMDLHLFDVDRTQNFVGRIDGDGSAFSLISEWGLMHDILNQYVVGNLYARMGYNFGFNVKEKVEGDDYMRLRSDGYFILTPGYSLTAQKRIYPSAWFQIRPYASIGVEYDVAGIPDSAQYKFAPSDVYTDYDVDINPLWANIGGGVEMLSANGVQFGIDYRYQYNSDIQLHNIRVSGSYRF
ncbi:MAG: autotransporter outer membrane beta-barrel domain-containing protein, partial [Alphaproteobacteria bacterium]|nr:autotransporter outer membrane beta-barrel domain-containing protein [Alphaproteobacteria bacterium]